MYKDFSKNYTSKSTILKSDHTLLAKEAVWYSREEHNNKPEY